MECGNRVSSNNNFTRTEKQMKSNVSSEHRQASESNTFGLLALQELDVAFVAVQVNTERGVCMAYIIVSRIMAALSSLNARI
jgi:hypothetical protein